MELFKVLLVEEFVFEFEFVVVVGFGLLLGGELLGSTANGSSIIDFVFIFYAFFELMQ